MLHGILEARLQTRKFYPVALAQEFGEKLLLNFGEDPLTGSVLDKLLGGLFRCPDPETVLDVIPQDRGQVDVEDIQFPGCRQIALVQFTQPVQRDFPGRERGRHDGRRTAQVTPERQGRQCGGKHDPTSRQPHAPGGRLGRQNGGGSGDSGKLCGGLGFCRGELTGVQRGRRRGKGSAGTAFTPGNGQGRQHVRSRSNRVYTVVLGMPQHVFADGRAGSIRLPYFNLVLFPGDIGKVHLCFRRSLHGNRVQGCAVIRALRRCQDRFEYGSTCTRSEGKDCRQQEQGCFPPVHTAALPACRRSRILKKR